LQAGLSAFSAPGVPIEGFYASPLLVLQPRRRRVQTSEAKYVKKLKATINAFMVPLHDARVLTASELGAVFRGLTDMRDVHSKLNSVIQAAGEDDNVANGIAVVANEFSL